MEITKRHLILGGGHVAALTLLLLSACGPGGGHDDSGQPIPDAGPMADSDVDMPDANVPPGDSGDMMPDLGVDGGTVPTCSPAEVASRTPGCGAQYDLPAGESYHETAMNSACMTTLSTVNSWAMASMTGCNTDVFREPGTNQWMLNFSCPGAGAAPYYGLYRLGPGGSWYGNCGNRALPGDPGNCGILVPSPDCTSLFGEFYAGAQTVAVRHDYWREAI